MFEERVRLCGKEYQREKRRAGRDLARAMGEGGGGGLGVGQEEEEETREMGGGGDRMTE